ncbi:MAG TPA: IS3 family transposase [Nitrososphaeraceae archaeon]
MVKTIVNNNNTTRRISIRKALRYSGCSKNMYYGKDHRNGITATATAATAATAVTPSITIMIEQKIQQISMERPTYGTRRMAAMLTRILGIPINRKRVQRIFRKMGYITPSKSKKEILRSKVPNVKADRPNQVWEADLTYIHCGIDGWGYLFNVFDVFTREWVGYCFDLSAVKDNAIISIENALVTHKGIVPENLIIRTDNGSQYTSKAFRKSLSVIGLKLEHICYNTPEQNGHIESFHKTLKKEYIWSNDFQNYQEAESSIKDAFTDYNQNRIHSALGYLTPYEFISKLKRQQQIDYEKVINIGNE